MAVPSSLAVEEEKVSQPWVITVGKKLPERV